jgi:aarF domain-containing kinase
VRSLVRDVISAVVEVGPQAGPMRTLEAYRAVATTFRDLAPQIMTAMASAGRTNGGSESPSSSSPQLPFPVILRTLFERMGSTYIKLGQFIASSPTLFPKEYVVEFQKCLDKTEPIPWSSIEAVLNAELGGPAGVSRVFASIDRTPLASASIAQVHCAKLRTGEDVVIKVQKPGIDASLKADLSFLYVAARVLEFLVPDWERTSLSLVAGDLRSSMLEELDFVKEATNTIEFRRFLQENDLMKQATAPRVYLEHTTKKVLVLERLQGVSLLDQDSIDAMVAATGNAGLGTDVILNALNIWSLSVTAMPWFHADVHAGNLLLLEDGRVGFIDFGIVGRISDKVFQSVSELSTALALSDSRGMARALCNMGATDDEVNVDRFAADIDRLMAKMNQVQPQVTVTRSAVDGRVTGGGIGIDETEITDLLLEFVEVTENNGLKLPREFGLLVKQSLYFDRYLKILAPDVDVMNDDRVQFGGKTKADAAAALVGTGAE